MARPVIDEAAALIALKAMTNRNYLNKVRGKRALSGGMKTALAPKLLALSLHEQLLEMMERGEDSVTGFISGVKSKVAEFGAADQFRESG